MIAVIIDSDRSMTVEVQPLCDTRATACPPSAKYLHTIIWLLIQIIRDLLSAYSLLIAEKWQI